MRVPSFSSTQRGLQFNMTPMIDIVFLLIIFFLVSSHLAKQETQLQLHLPVASTGQEPSENNTPRVTINIQPSGQTLLGSVETTPAELTSRLLLERQHAGPNLEVRIRSDRKVLYQFIEPVLTACTEAGLWNVSFAVTTE